MNEQLIVKNFGPIKDATVDFKKVTVFIGPTGGGKSTLAKLAAVFMDNDFMDALPNDREIFFNNYSIDKYLKKTTSIEWGDDKIGFSMGKEFGKNSTKVSPERRLTNADFLKEISKEPTFLRLINEYNKTKTLPDNEKTQATANEIAVFLTKLMTQNRIKRGVYIPTERMFVPAVEFSWAGLLRDDIGLPKVILNFANAFSVAKPKIKELNIPFLNIKYIHSNGQDFIKLATSKSLLRLYETASGIQSVTPLLVLLEHLSRQKEQTQSFIIEEPELNLYPTAQQGLLNWLVEKCTAGENDLTITTHSPYILSHLNLLLYAYQVAEKHPDRADDVAKIVPRESWINPKEFACYQVENGGVQSLVNEDLGLIDNNELDALSGDASDAFDNLIRLSKGITIK